MIISREGRFFNLWYCERSAMLIASAESRSAKVVKEGCYFGGVYLSLGEGGKLGQVRE